MIIHSERYLVQHNGRGPLEPLTYLELEKIEIAS